MAAVTTCSDFGAPKNKVSQFPLFPRLFAMKLVFELLSFKPTFSLSSFTFIKRLFSSSLLSARVGVGLWWATAGLGALSVAVCAQDLLKEVAIIFITST